MKLSVWAMLVLTSFAFFACDKDKHEHEEFDIDKLEVCSWDGSLVADTTLWEAVVIEPLVEDAACGCYASGIIGYRKKGASDEYPGAIYTIKYGVDENDCSWAALMTCESGNCPPPHGFHHDDEEHGGCLGAPQGGEGEGHPHHGKRHGHRRHHGKRLCEDGSLGCDGAPFEKPELCKFQQTDCGSETTTTTTDNTDVMSRMKQ